MSTPDTARAEFVFDPEVAESRKHLRWILSALMLTMLLAALDQTIVSTALPRITSELNGLNELSWVITAYLLASTASTPIWGKLSDLYGRKVMLQSAVAVFVGASMLAGLSQNMAQLIGTRALQGIGGGGIMVLVMAVIADLIPPRDRGRYAGLFGAVFGLSSVIGPLLGGFFTEQLSWRWIFYINVPLGIAAFAALAIFLHLPVLHEKKPIDWLGSALLVAGVTMVLLVTVWGGQEYDWTSPTIIGLAIGGVAALAVFVWHELRTEEPIVPMSLFSNRVFRVSSMVGFIVGFAMFGSIVYLSIYFQVVRGATPTQAGLMLLPLMLGILITSILSGQLIARMGRYKVFPIIGTGLAAIGIYMMSKLGVDSPFWYNALAMFILGAGLGNVMQTLVLAVQNTVAPQQMGAATSGATFFRSIGGSFGTAFFGAVWTARLTAELNAAFPGGTGQIGDATSSIGSIEALPPAIQETVLQAFANAIDTTFLVAVPFMVVAFLLAWLLPEVRLKTKRDVAHELADDAAVPLPMALD
jgi:EmrB/QacA subfamily drug resistance transporter